MERIVRGLACLAEGLGICATARVFEGAPNTVLHWLAEAAEQLRAGFDHRAGHLRSLRISGGSHKPLLSQLVRFFSLRQRLLEWPAP